MNVLVVDDNESVADSLAFLLDCYGHHAVVAYDGGTALALLRTGAFEITFLDENLPDIKGSAVALSLKETSVRSGAFLVSMTGDAESQGDFARLQRLAPHEYRVLIQRNKIAMRDSESSKALSQKVVDVIDEFLHGLRSFYALSCASRAHTASIINWLDRAPGSM